LSRIAVAALLALIAAACGGGAGGDQAADDGAATAEESADAGGESESSESSGASESSESGGSASGGGAEVEDNPDAGVSADTIRIGWMGDVTGPTAAAQSFNLRGAEAAVAWVNENGGVLGRQLELDVQDDQYNAEEATTNYAALTQDDPVLAIIQMGGSHISTALAPDVESDGIPVISPPQTIDAQLEVPNFYNNLAHYGDEADVAVAYIGETLGSVEDAVVAVVQLEVPSGSEWNTYIEATLEEQGGTYAGVVTVNVSAPDYPGTVGQLEQLINDQGVNFIAFHGAPENGLGVVSEMVRRGLTDVPLVGIHGLAGGTVFTEGPPEAAELVAAAHSFLSPLSDCEMCETAREFVQGTEWEEAAAELNFGDGWQDILIVQQAAERAAEESGELSWESMNAALTSGPFDVGGLSCDPDWSESNHSPCAAIYRWEEDHPEPVNALEENLEVIDGEYGLFTG
jgi:branched-chain amino acid transport system substrate-binding protein